MKRRAQLVEAPVRAYFDRSFRSFPAKLTLGFKDKGLETCVPQTRCGAAIVATRDWSSESTGKRYEEAFQQELKE